MSPASLNTQAAQAATQGQSQLADYNNNANTYKDQYAGYQGQADTANQQVKDYTGYMAGAGSAGNQYHNELGTQLGQLGYDPAQMTAARSNLNQSTGALSAYSDYANQAASKFGLNAGGFAAANSGALGNLNNNVATNQGVVNGLSGLYTQAQTGANQFAGLQVQGEQNTLAGYQNVYQNAANQRDSASQMMNFYDQLAQQQGGLNAQQQQYYASAQQALASSQASMAQAGLYTSQAAQQRLQTSSIQDAINQYGLSTVLGLKVGNAGSTGGVQVQGSPGQGQSLQVAGGAQRTAPITFNGSALQGASGGIQ